MKPISIFRRVLISGIVLFSLGVIHIDKAQAEFTPFMSEAQEKKLGAEEHPKILEQMGGPYGDSRISNYVATIGKRMMAASAKPGGNYTVTLLDTPMINAFAIPGGYVYVTRGILAIANSEAEVAAVMGHEIGHVTARHSAKRYNTAIGAGLLGVIVGAVVGSDIVSQLFNIGAQGAFASYSRGQERDSDKLGITSLAKAGYDPYGMANFLTAMQAEQDLERRIWGQAVDPAQSSFFSTHPSTPQRIADARVMAKPLALSGSQPAQDEAYLRAIDGMTYSSSAKEGYIRGRRFAHPKMLITFEVPQGFQLKNTSEAVLAGGPQGAAVKLDGGKMERTSRVEDYLVREWAAELSLRNVERLTINGMPAATATTSQQGKDLRLGVIDAGGTIYRFIIITPRNLTARFDGPLRAMMMSFRKLSPGEGAALKPLRVRIRKVAPGQDVAYFARQMDFEDFREERFRVLNGLSNTDRLIPGRLVKVISE